MPHSSGVVGRKGRKRFCPIRGHEKGGSAIRPATRPCYIIRCALPYGAVPWIHGKIAAFYIVREEWQATVHHDAPG